MKETKLHFQRFEFKYLLNWREFYEIRDRLKPFVSLDGYAKTSKSGFYEVASLYFDSPKFYYYYEKIDGVRNRKKIRLRAYKVDDKPVGYTFFEIKRKNDAVILKDRFLLDRDDYEIFIKTGSFYKTKIYKEDNAKKIIQEYDIERFRRALEPKILVNYAREPYLGKYNKNFRVTFDYNIEASESKRLIGAECETNVLKDKLIMEIKFNGRLPYYIREIIEKYNLERSAYSKYCRAAESCYVFDDINYSKNYFFNVDKKLLNQQYERTI